MRSGHDHEHEHDEIYNRGLAFDLGTLLDRRRALQLLAGAGLVALTGCAGSSSTTTPTAGTTASTAPDVGATAAAAAASCEVIPAETGGPFPGDGSNGPDVLTQSGIVRSDIRSSFGSSSGTAAGVPLTVNLVLQDQSNGCVPLAGAAVYLWHCDRAGRYSLYSDGVTGENYLRGVQRAGADGRVSFRSIVPAAYSGRWPHIHFEVYPDLAAATSAGSKLATSQVALPESLCTKVYATAAYEQSISNMAQTSLQRDMVFGDDGGVRQLADYSGSVAAGYTVTLVVPV